MRARSAAYEVQRLKQAATPVYLCRFFHVNTYGDGVDYAFSVDFSTAPIVSNRQVRSGYLFPPSGNTQTIEPENGRSSVGTFLLRLVDVDGEVLRYLSPCTHTLLTPMTATTPANGGAIAFNETKEHLPKLGTLEITTSGVIERIRYSARGRGVVTGITRGVDGTVAATHNAGDAVTNGEQIRPGTRAQLFAGYASLGLQDFMRFSKMEVAARNVEADGITFDVQLADVQRTLRRQIFLLATEQAPVPLVGNPVDIALAILTSTGNRTVGAGTVTVTAGFTTVTGTGTTFTTTLTAGSAVFLSTGEIVRVNSVTDDTHFTTVVNVAVTGIGLSYWIGGTLKGGQGGLTPVVAGVGTITTLAGVPTVSGIGTAFLTFLAEGNSVLTQTGETLTVSKVLNDTAFIASPAPLNTGSNVAYWLEGQDVGVPAGAPPGGRYDILDAANGLAVAPSFVDIGGLEALRDSAFAGQVYGFSITSPQDGKTALESDIWKTLEAYPVIKQDGRYSAKRYTGLAGVSIFSFTEANILSAGWSLGDQRIINVVAFSYDWNLPSAKQVFGTQQIYTHSGSVAKYGRRPPLIIQSHGIQTFFGGQAIVDSRALEVIRRFADPPPVLVLEVAYVSHPLEIGDRVDVTHSQIPNIRTGVRGLAGELFEIIDATPVFETGRMRFSLLWIGAMTDPGAPSSDGGVSLTPTPRLELYGYRLDINSTTFTSGLTTGSNGDGWALAVDDVNKKLNILNGGGINENTAVSLSQADFHAKILLATTAKFAAPQYAVQAAAFDGVNIQIGLADLLVGGANAIRYARLAQDGTILQSPVDKFSVSGMDQFSPKLAVSGSTLYWVWFDTTNGNAVSLRVMYGATDLSGNILVNPVVAVDHTSDATQLWAPAITVDSLGNVHIVYGRRNIADLGLPGTYAVNYVKLSRVGVVLIPDTQIVNSTGYHFRRPDGLVIDEKDRIHMIMHSQAAGATGSLRQYVRFDTFGKIIVPPVTIFGDPSWTQDAKGGVARDSTTGSIFIAIPKDTAQGVILRLSRIE